MYEVVLMSLLQSFLLASAQIVLKTILNRAPQFEMTFRCLNQTFLTWWTPLLISLFVLSTLLWLYILRTYPFSVSYPLTSFAYVFGMIAAIVVFKESVPWTRWIGVGLIMVGAFFLTRK